MENSRKTVVDVSRQNALKLEIKPEQSDENEAVSTSNIQTYVQSDLFVEEGVEESFEHSDEVKESSCPSDIFHKLIKEEYHHEVIQNPELNNSDTNATIKYEPDDHVEERNDVIKESEDNCELEQSRPSKIQKVKSTKEKYLCSVCGKTFLKAGGLKYHYFIHTGEKPHECSICSKRFRSSSTLKNHLHIHSGEKPHECSICSKTFTQFGNLKRHLLIHSKK